MRRAPLCHRKGPALRLRLVPSRRRLRRRDRLEAKNLDVPRRKKWPVTARLWLVETAAVDATNARQPIRFLNDAVKMRPGNLQLITRPQRGRASARIRNKRERQNEGHRRKKMSRTENASRSILFDCTPRSGEIRSWWLLPKFVTGASSRLAISLVRVSTGDTT